jgi:glycosyltransferase involved in cell wall biosynthesis
MYSRPALSGPNIPLPPTTGRKRILCLLPAHNEAANLPVVVAEIRKRHPRFDVLVVDDGSTDETAALLPHLAVRFIRLPERMGIGTAMRAGLRYAERVGYDIVVRMDSDGQHRADDIEQLLAALDSGADVVLGSRFAKEARRRTWLVQLVQRVLAACLSTLTGKTVTDPTSGFCALGPRAVRVLAEHHPTGYPEAELRLFLSSNGLRTVEVPVSGRSRLVGKTSLTPRRMTAAASRVMLAMIVVPFRGRVEGADD